MTDTTQREINALREFREQHATEVARGKARRGFASMTGAQQRAIASKGGKAAHAIGTAHEWTPDTARSAGAKGGAAVSKDREHMAAIGRRGGEARAARMRARAAEAV